MPGHRSHLKQKNKPHKSGHSAKNPFKIIKQNVAGPSQADEKGQKGRRLQAQGARRQNKLDDVKLAKQIGTRNGAPKILGILPCTEGADAVDFVSKLEFEAECEDHSYPSGRMNAGQFECKILPLAIERDLDQLLDVGKATDLLILLMVMDEEIDEFGRMAVSVLKSIGMPMCMCIVLTADGSPVPRSYLVEMRNVIQKDLPDCERVLGLASDEDFEQFVRFVSVTVPKKIAWKENRPWMMIQGYEILEGTGTVEIHGYLRNARLNVHQVVTIPYLGDYHIHSANDIIPDDSLRHPIIYEFDEEDDIMTADIQPPQTRTTVEGTMEEVRQMAIEEAYEPENEEMDDEDMEYAEEIWKREKDELEFPDEFDYDPDVLLRERLRRYRSLKSFRDSPWDPYEDLPAHYGRIHEFSNFPRTSEAAIAEQGDGDIEPGERCSIKLLVGDEEMERWKAIPSGRPLSMYGLFRHETKMTVLNCSFLNTSDDIVMSSSSKTPYQMMVVCGFRHMTIHPKFSEDDRASKHLYLRDVEAGSSAICSFIGPAVMQGCPCSYFIERDDVIYPVGTGSIKTVDPCRMIIKRIRITGRLYKTEGRTARVTMMFFNRGDVNYYKSVGLETKKKRRGNVVKAVGEKGHFKAVFHDIISSDDTVYMSLYRRVYPKLTITKEDGTTEPATIPVLFST